MHSPQRAVVFADSPVTVLASDRLILVDASGGPVVLNFPTAVAKKSRTFEVIKTDASVNAVTLTPAGGQTINGAATLAITVQWQLVGITSNGTNYIGLYGAIGGSSSSAVVITLDDSTTDAYVAVVTLASSTFVDGIGTIVNTDGANSLTVQETATDYFGNTISVETVVPFGENYMLDVRTNFSPDVGVTNAFPPFTDYVVEVKSTSTGDVATFELRFGSLGLS